MTKIHYRPYNPNQTVLFPQRIDEDIAENDPMRMVDALIESLNLESFRKLYKGCGLSPYHPKMMLKVILYAYMKTSTPALFQRLHQPECRINTLTGQRLNPKPTDILSSGEKRLSVTVNV